MDKIKIEPYSGQTLKKCCGCEAVSIIRYKLVIYDREIDAIQSEFQLCKRCGDNIFMLLNPEATTKPDEIIKHSFNFKRKNTRTNDIDQV